MHFQSRLRKSNSWRFCAKNALGRLDIFISHKYYHCWFSSHLTYRRCRYVISLSWETNCEFCPLFFCYRHFDLIHTGVVFDTSGTLWSLNHWHQIAGLAWIYMNSFYRQLFWEKTVQGFFAKLSSGDMGLEEVPAVISL